MTKTRRTYVSVDEQTGRYLVDCDGEFKWDGELLEDAVHERDAFFRQKLQEVTNHLNAQCAEGNFVSAKADVAASLGLISILSHLSKETVL